MNGAWSALGATALLAVASATRSAREAGSRAKRPWAYHVTYEDCLLSIARDGLVPQPDTQEAWGNPPGVYLVAKLGAFMGPKPDEPAWLRFPWPEVVRGVPGDDLVTHADVLKYGEGRTGPVAPGEIEILVGQDGTPGGRGDREATWVPLQAYVARKTGKGSRARTLGEPPAHAYLPLATIDRYVPAMQRLGVSEVARSPRGFLAAYRAAGGNVENLSPAWRQRREGFIARHVAQVRERGEPLVDAQGNPTRRHLALVAWAYSPFPEVVGSLAREPYVNYGQMWQRELENFRVLLQGGVTRRRAVVARYQDEAAKDPDPLGRRVRLDLAERQRGPLAWHQEELGYLEAQQRRRGSRAKPMVLSSRGWIPATPALPSTTLRWDQLPDDVRSDGFLLASIHDGGLRRPHGSTVLAVTIRPLDDAWRLFRAVFPGRDIGGNPAAPDAEDHWDERGPAHVVTLMNLLEAVFPDPATATPEDVLQKWMREDRAVTYEEPEFDPDFDDVPPGHSTLASTVQTIGPPHPGMLLPPLVVDADGFVDGRHRIYAARLAGLRYVPVLDLSQLEKR